MGWRRVVRDFFIRVGLLYEIAKTSSWNRGLLKILNGIKLILNDQGNHLDSNTISLESFRSFRGQIFRKPVTGQELFLSVSYNKPALVQCTLIGLLNTFLHQKLNG